jgi:hypothetical protein
VLALGVLIIAGMVLFPPWLLVYEPPHFAASDFNKTERPAGYHLLFSPHVVEDPTELAHVFNLPPGLARRLDDFSVVIDKDRLTVQLGGVLAITVLLAVMLGSKK